MDSGNKPAVAELRTKLRSFLGDLAKLCQPLVSRTLVATAAVLTALSLFVVTPSVQAAPASAVWCWCTEYVRNAYNLGRNFPNATDWAGLYNGSSLDSKNAYLVKQGFRKVSAPAPWAIVVFSNQYPGIWDEGHVALAAYWNRTDKGWNLTVRGANQYANSDNVWEEKDCTDVSDWTLGNPVPYNSPYVTYWVR